MFFLLFFLTANVINQCDYRFYHTYHSCHYSNSIGYFIQYYYYTCYIKLGKYEDCAAYLLGLAKEWQTEEFPSTRLPFKSEIVRKLTELNHMSPQKHRKKSTTPASC